MPVNLWKIIKLIPGFSSLHTPFQAIIIFIFILSALSGYGMTLIEQRKINLRFKPKNIRILLGMVCVIVLGDYMTSYYSDLGNIFSYDASNKEYQPQVFLQTLTFEKYGRRGEYPNFLMNKGSLQCFDPLVIPVKESQKKFWHIGYAIPEEYEDYRGETFVADSKGTTEIIFWSPNKVLVRYESDDNGFLVLNQNYFTGWKAKTDSKKEIVKYQNLIATKIGKEKGTIKFYFFPNPFIIGSIISIISLILFITIFLWKKKATK